MALFAILAKTSAFRLVITTFPSLSFCKLLASPNSFFKGIVPPFSVPTPIVIIFNPVFSASIAAASAFSEWSSPSEIMISNLLVLSFLSNCLVAKSMASSIDVPCEEIIPGFIVCKNIFATP